MVYEFVNSSSIDFGLSISMSCCKWVQNNLVISNPEKNRIKHILYYYLTYIANLAMRNSASEEEYLNSRQKCEIYLNQLCKPYIRSFKNDV